MISLASNLFYGTTIAVNILVLSKSKTDTTTQFIDASGLFKKETNNNILSKPAATEKAENKKSSALQEAEDDSDDEAAEKK